MIFFKRMSTKAGILVPFLLHTISAVAQPRNAPLSSQSNIYTYFTPGAAAMPPGSDFASKAVIHLNSDLGTGEPNGNNRNCTAFLIRTFLEDTQDSNKVCMCLTGHSIINAYSPQTPVIGSAVPFNSVMYMDYLGTELDSAGQLRNKVTNFSKGMLSTGKLLAHYYTPIDGDIALVLIDKQEIPSLSFGELGYDFDNNVWANGNTFYAIGHPWKYPQRISDNIQIDAVYPSVVDTKTAVPYAFGPGSSGSPVLVKSRGTGNTVTVTGVETKGFEPKGVFTDLDARRYYFYTIYNQVSKMSLLEPAIRKRCWNKRDSTDISTTGRYKQSVYAGNASTWEAFTQNKSVTSISTLFNSALSMLLAGPSRSIRFVRLNANNCNISGFTLPTIYPGESNPLQVTIAAKEISVTSDFNYTAADASELNLASVVIGTTTSSTLRKSPDTAAGQISERTHKDGPFNVYPNPGPDGLFYIRTPPAMQYQVVVSSLDGKIVAQSNCTTTPYPLQLSSVSRGTYILTIYTLAGKEMVYKKLIVY